jgi:hypothetical protein
MTQIRMVPENTQKPVDAPANQESLPGAKPAEVTPPADTKKEKAE